MGHWGFQYYAEQIGGEIIDKFHPPALQPGDLVVVAKTAWPERQDPPTAAALEFEATEFSVKNSLPVRTISCDAGANFYGNRLPGCIRPAFLPFGFSREPLETFLIYRMRKK